MKWVHVTRLLLPHTLTSGRSPAEVVADMDASLPEGGYLPGVYRQFSIPSEPVDERLVCPKQAWRCCRLRSSLGMWTWSES